jgi:hypothetical protein
MNTIAEFLFYLLGGVPIIATPWIILWVVIFAMLIAICSVAIMFADYMGLLLVEIIVSVCFAVLVFISLLSPSIQTNLMSECRTVETEISVGLSEPKVMTLSECRSKDNYYDTFGPWTISLGNIQ